MECKKSAELDDCKVSIIVPVYNVEEYLRECVDSLLGQTLKNIEILLIDDGSTDSSGAICDRYASEYSNVRVIHKTNGGQGAARNLGLSQTKGEYVYYMDSDDILELNALNVLYCEAEKNNLDVIMFSAECFGDSPEINYNPDEYKRTKHLHEVKNGEELFANLYNVREYYCSIPMRFFNRKYLIENEFVFPEHIIHEDEIFGFFSLIKAKRAKCIPDRFYKRRYRKGSTMTGKRAYNSAVGYLYTWEKILVFCTDAESKSKSSYLKFARELFKIARKMYYEVFDDIEKKQFNMYRTELRKTLHKKNIKPEKGELFFLVNPFFYGVYRNIINKKNNLGVEL